MSVASQKRHPFKAYFNHGTGKNQLQSGQENMGEAQVLVTLFFANKSLTKTDRCAGALSLKRDQLLLLSFSGHFL
jgi:hypothetical protein